MIEIPTLDEDAGTAPVAPTLRRMADAVVGKPDVSAAFDRGSNVANLVLEDALPVWPKNPVPSGTARRKPSSPTRQRPPGAEDLEGLFATGFILLTVFAVGEWATPTADESTAIARPLANILARRIDLAAKLGRDASDTIALAIALLSYLARVGPVAAERVRDGLAARRKPERVAQPGRPADRPAHGSGEDSVASRNDNGPGTFNGSPLDPFAAIAQARNAGVAALGGSLGNAPAGNPALGDR